MSRRAIVPVAFLLLCACAGRGADEGLAPPPPCTRPAVWPEPEASAQTLYDAYSFLFAERRDGDVVTRLQDYRTPDPDTLGIVQGTVRGTSGEGLGCVSVAVLGRPEFAAVQTRADGRFAIAMKGEGALTLTVTRPGYLGAVREVAVWPRRATALPPVTLVAREGGVSHELRLGQGSAQSLGGPQHGAGSGLLFVPTGAEATLADAALGDRPLRLNLTDLGESLAARPAALPPGGRRRGVHLWLRPAGSEGEEEAPARFSRPLFYSLPNDPPRPVGTEFTVRTLAPQELRFARTAQGRVIKILAVVDGLAQLDVSGLGEAARTPELVALGITADERRALAERYPVGQELWRAPVDGAGAIDLSEDLPLPGRNLARPPYQSVPSVVASEESGTCNGSKGTFVREDLAIDCAHRQLRLQVPLHAAPLDGEPKLVYSDSLRPGSEKEPTAERTVRIWLTTADYKSDGIAAVKLDLWLDGAKVNGKEDEPDVTFDPGSLKAGDSYLWSWDGNGGRSAQPQLTARVTYEYVDSAPLPVTWTPVPLRIAQAPPTLKALQGLSLDAVHHYDNDFQMLYRGDGTVKAVGPSLPYYATEGLQLPASSNPAALAIGKMSALYVANQDDCNVQLVATKTLVFGAPDCKGTDDGKPTALEMASNKESLYIGALVKPTEGRLYRLTTADNTLVKVKDSDGRSDASFGEITALAVDPDDMRRLYVLQRDGNLLLVVVDDRGVLQERTSLFPPKEMAPFVTPRGLALQGINGKHHLFVANTGMNQIERLIVDRGKVLSRTRAVFGDPDKPLISPHAVRVLGGGDGARDLFIVDSGNSVLRRARFQDPAIDKNSLEFVAGKYQNIGEAKERCISESLGIETRFNNPVDLVWDEHYLYVLDKEERRICKLLVLPSSRKGRDGLYLVPDGPQVHAFALRPIAGPQDDNRPRPLGQPGSIVWTSRSGVCDVLKPDMDTGACPFTTRFDYTKTVLSRLTTWTPAGVYLSELLIPDQGSTVTVRMSNTIIERNADLLSIKRAGQPLWTLNPLKEAGLLTAGTDRNGKVLGVNREEKTGLLKSVTYGAETLTLRP